MSRCLMCGRNLKSKASIARGMGPSCAKKAAKQGILEDLKEEQPTLPFMEEVKDFPAKEAS